MLWHGLFEDIKFVKLDVIVASLIALSRVKGGMQARNTLLSFCSCSYV